MIAEINSCTSFCDGNNVVEGRAILAEANHPLVTVVDTMDNAADKAAELAAAGA